MLINQLFNNISETAVYAVKSMGRQLLLQCFHYWMSFKYTARAAKNLQFFGKKFV